MNLRVALAVLVCAACKQPAPSVEDAGVVQADAPPAPALFAGEVASLRLRRSIAVRSEPNSESPPLGTVARDTRVRWLGAAAGPGCEARWIHIYPRGYVCESHLEASERKPFGVELPRLQHGEIVPGRYAKAIAEEPRVYQPLEDPGEDYDAGPGMVVVRELQGSVMVRHGGDLDADGERYWKIAKGEYVPTTELREYRPSRYSGSRLGDETGLGLPVYFAVGLADPSKSVRVYEDAELSRLAKKLPRTPVEVLETRKIKRGSVRRTAEGWIHDRDIRTVTEAPAPAEIRPNERWLDINLSAQSLIAYEGRSAVYVTLISSGTPSNATETGIYRVFIKFAETTMSSNMSDESPYSVATVPWTQFYAKDLALHTSYWHDHFGMKKSHGCINLAPADARFLYFWSDPQVPAGWSMANGRMEHPGSLVRVRSRQDPTPPYRGYAEDLRRARGVLGDSSGR